MSATSMPATLFGAPSVTTRSQALVEARAATSHVIRRRPTMQQGRALETLGHAVEYLIDSQLHLCQTSPESQVAANQILMRLSREVFGECAEIVPLRRRIGQKAARLWAMIGLEESLQAEAPARS